MAKCNRCEALPDIGFQNGTLYMSPPMEPTLKSIERILKNHSVCIEYPAENILAIPYTKKRTCGFCRDFLSNLNAMELKDTKCLFLPQGQNICINLFKYVQTLEEFLSRSDNEWFIQLLAEERLVSWFQPIVNAKRPDHVFAYECLIRGKSIDGKIIYPPELFSTARSTDMLFHLDRVSRQTAVKDAARQDISNNIFINFNPTTIYDPKHCLKTTMETIQKTGISAEKIVFEVVETDQVRDIKHLLNIIRFYRKKGFRIALDDLGAGYSSLNLLHHIRPDFIKIDMELIRDVDQDPYKGMIVKNLLMLAENLGIETIAEGVERTQEWKWLVDNKATYIQGYLFAKPAAVPPVPNVPV